MAKGQARSTSRTVRLISTSPVCEPPTEDVDADYPLILTTGRVISQFLSGNQTRRIGPLVDQYPEPLLELHPILAQQHGITDQDWVAVESRRGSVILRCQVVTTIRPDVVFVPYHWAGGKSINLVTIAAQDPMSKIPEYKVCAVRLRKAEEPSTPELSRPSNNERTNDRPNLEGRRWPVVDRDGILRGSESVYRVPRLRTRLLRMRHP